MYESSQNPPSSERAGSPLVLLVEDECSIAEPFARAVHRAGFQTALAGTASEAILLTATRGPDVILLDLELPAAELLAEPTHTSPVCR